MLKMFHYPKILYNSMRKDGIKKTFGKLFTKYSPCAQRKYQMQYEQFVKKISVNAKLAIFFAGALYEKDMNQRSINCAKYLVSKGYTVLFILWQWSPNHVVWGAFTEVDRKTFCIPLYSLDLSQLTFVKEIIGVCTIVSPILTELIQQIKQLGGKTYYDIYDDWGEFKRIGFAEWYPGRAGEEQLITIADKVSAVTKSLADKFREVRKDIIVSPNGFDIDVVGKHNRNIVKPIKDEIVIGYFGHLTSPWINWQFVFNLAKINKVRVEIIGNGERPPLLAEFKRYGIKFHGHIPANELHYYAKSWHFGLVPFITSQISVAVDPIKVYEYLYYGLTCLVTGIPHLQGCPNTLYFNDVDKLSYKYLADNHNFSNSKCVDKFLETNTWDKQFDKLFVMSKD
jgi:hypothetical protein